MPARPKKPGGGFTPGAGGTGGGAAAGAWSSGRGAMMVDLMEDWERCWWGETETGVRVWDRR
jgi:hypothetical protein